MKTERNNFQKGAALPFVIIVFVIATTIASIVYSYFSLNIRQAVLQQKNIQAYYCTLYGLDMATGALLMENPNYLDAMSTPGVPETLLQAFNEDASKTLTDTISIEPGRKSVDVTITRQDSNTDCADPPARWIVVQAEGKYTDAGGKTYTNKGSVWYRADNPAVFRQYLDPD